MVGKRLSFSVLATAAVMTATAARAADYPQPPPPPPIIVPPPQDCCDNWYLRGHVGVGMPSYDLEYLPAVSNDFAFEHNSIGDTYFIGFGVGYEINNWLRFDVTVDYRAKTRIYAFGAYNNGTILDTYEGNLKSWVFLGNAYVDLGTWNCFTPFVGIGIGGAYNMLEDFTDIGPQTGGRGFGRDSSQWNFAWALHAGVAYNVTKNFKIELSYRYLNYGDVTDTIDCVGGCTADSYKIKNLYSHDIMLGLRWNCCEDFFAPPPPRYVYTPPPPVYAPPPVYPLRSRG